MDFVLLPFTARYWALTASACGFLLLAILFVVLPDWRVMLALPVLLLGTLGLLGVHDLIQTRHAILRNYPVIAHLRFFFEKIRPEMRQYFFEADNDGAPFPRDKRAIVYQRAKRA